MDNLEVFDKAMSFITQTVECADVSELNTSVCGLDVEWSHRTYVVPAEAAKIQVIQLAFSTYCIVSKLNSLLHVPTNDWNPLRRLFLTPHVLKATCDLTTDLILLNTFLGMGLRSDIYPNNIVNIRGKLPS